MVVSTIPQAAPSTVGLSSQDAALRLQQDGPNEVQHKEGPSPVIIFLAQFRSPIVLLLVGACIVSAALGEIVDAAAIMAILVINAGVGFLQEYRAERALRALRDLTAPRARVQRDGHTMMIPARDVVRGDRLLLEAGDVVAADAQLVEAHALTTQEAALTGESMPVEKRVGHVPDNAPLAERANAVFQGTIIATGTGAALVTATGMSTELGKIAHLLSTAEERDTPLQQRLAVVSRSLLILCVIVVGIITGAGIVHGETWLTLLMSSVSLAVAAVPEGLPAIVTIALAVGVQRMARKRALVRRLPAVETLGCTTVICTDKTGTLTTGVMEVREIVAHDPVETLRAAAACSDADLGEEGAAGEGDPTELAILRRARVDGIQRADIERDAPRVNVHPFDSDRRRMSIFRADGVLYVKGAVEAVLPLCSSGTEDAQDANARMAGRALRVLAVATGSVDDEKDLRFLGLLGFADAPRPEAIAAIAAARAAGIRTIMITGDHPLTAQAIAREMGIVVGNEDPAEAVHARATAADKLHIVRKLKAEGHVAAMTGDGVNDAPALREADVGVAMGVTGTEVTRESADVVLTDDNYATIVGAVAEGRAIYDNIRKSLIYLLSGNTAELLVMLCSALAGLPIPLLPLHLLWVNLVTDGFPALALVMEPAEGDVLSRPPRRVDEPILTRAHWMRILMLGTIEALTVLLVFAWSNTTWGIEAARAHAFTALVLSELTRSFSSRSSAHSAFALGFLSNVWLVAAVAAGVVLQLVVIAFEPVAGLLGTRGLVPSALPFVVGAALVPAICMELLKHMGGPRAPAALNPAEHAA